MPDVRHERALRAMIEARFDALKSGRAKLIDGEDAYRRLMARTEAQRRQHRSATD